MSDACRAARLHLAQCHLSSWPFVSTAMCPHLPTCLPPHRCLDSRPPTPSAPRRPRSFLTVTKCLHTGKISHFKSQFLMVTPGILGKQVGAGQRVPL